jgi:phenylalanyl-tRNA synthetase alpha subunit
VPDDLLLERHPYTVSQANSSSGDHEADKTYVKLATLKSVALLALRNVYKVASHTFHVYLWDLFPGTRGNESHVFTRVRQRRNQYLVEAKQAEINGLQLRPHSANDALTFLHKHVVKENSDQFIIK